MEEHGIVIFKNGVTLSFGKYFCPDEAEFEYSSSHESAFLHEIVPTIEFEESNYIYNYGLRFYDNIADFCSDGLIIILNKQQTTISPTRVEVFLPDNPTEEQKESLQQNETLSKIMVQDVYEFKSYKFEDCIKHDSIEDYIRTKGKQIN